MPISVLNAQVHSYRVREAKLLQIGIEKNNLICVHIFKSEAFLKQLYYRYQKVRTSIYNMLIFNFFDNTFLYDIFIFFN